MLYQLSYLGARFMSRTALQISCNAVRFGNLATLMGLEPTTFAVTGRRSNQLSYSAKAGLPALVGTAGLEPATPRV